jgi:hypothetical protein
MKRSAWLLMGLAGALSAAIGPGCGSAVTTGSGGGATASSAGGGTSTATTATGTTSTATTGTSTASSTASGTGSTSSTGGGTMCGGFTGALCAADEFCDYGDDRCGVADGGGTCTKRPAGCGKNLQPTCACDGMMYDNPCLANAAGFDANDNGCPAPMGAFTCGSHFCTLGSQYCQHTTSDVGGQPDSYSCNPLPADCGAMPSCACLSAVPCAMMCVMTMDGGLMVNCPGG